MVSQNDEWIRSLQKRIEDVETRASRLEAWQSYTLGAAFVIGVVVTILGKKLLLLLGIG